MSETKFMIPGKTEIAINHSQAVIPPFLEMDFKNERRKQYDVIALKPL